VSEEEEANHGSPSLHSWVDASRDGPPRHIDASRPDMVLVMRDFETVSVTSYHRPPPMMQEEEEEEVLEPAALRGLTGAILLPELNRKFQAMIDCQYRGRDFYPIGFLQPRDAGYEKLFQQWHPMPSRCKVNQVMGWVADVDNLKLEDFLIFAPKELKRWVEIGIHHRLIPNNREAKSTIKLEVAKLVAKHIFGYNGSQVPWKVSDDYIDNILHHHLRRHL
jgi:uncharacterized protein (UPF0248 family)